MNQEELYHKQLQRELEQDLLGSIKAEKDLEKKIKRGEEATTSYGLSLVKKWVKPLSDRIEYELLAANERKVGRASGTTRMMPVLEMIGDTDKVAAITLHVVLGSITSPKKPAFTSTAFSIANHIEDEINFESVKKHDRVMAKLIEKQLQTKTNYAKKHESFAKLLTRVPRLGTTNLSRDAKTELGTTLIHWLSEVSNGNIYAENRAEFRSGKQVLRKFVSASEPLMKYITDANHNTFDLAVKHKPMLVKPTPWALRHADYEIKEQGDEEAHRPLAFSGGYLSISKRNLNLCKTRNKQQKALINGGGFDKLVLAINAAQDTGWRVRPWMLELQRTIYQMDSDWGADIGIPHSQPKAFIEKPWNIDTDEAARKAYRKTQADVYKENIERTSKRASYKLMFDTANELVSHSEFYNIWQLDSRSRGYPLGPLHCQGADPMKAMIEFAKGKPIDSTSVYWLKLQAANVIADDPWTGKNIDKEGLAYRVQWVDDNFDKLKEIDADHLGNLIWTEFDKPLQALAAIRELCEFEEQGDGYISHLPIALDGRQRRHP